MDIEKRMSEIADYERSLVAERSQLLSSNPAVFSQLEKIDEQLAQVQKMKDDVRAELIKSKDYDLHKVGNLKVSISNIAKVAVENIDDVPSEFKETKVVANEKKAQEYLKVMGEVPAGFIDKSYQRFSWKDGELDAKG